MAVPIIYPTWMFSTASIIISGPVTSGKSTIARAIAKKCRLELVNEENTGNYYKILDHVDPLRYPKAIYEHCWFYKKWYLVRALYDRSLLVILNPSDALLEDNYKKRKEIHSTGDYLNIDPIKQREQILNDVERLREETSNNHEILIVNIEKVGDYERAINDIVAKIN